MLDSLRRIVQKVTNAQDLDMVLEIIVHEVKDAMDTDVASVYLTDFERSQHVLLVTDGLRMESAGAVRLEMHEGLVGLVASRAEPSNLDNAREHPRFKWIPETGEEIYNAFLGVPIIHQGKVLGVLVVQSKQTKRFSEEKVSFLVTLAAQLASMIVHARVASEGSSVAQIIHSPKERFVSGVPGSPGVVIGIAVVVYPPADLDAVPNRKTEQPWKDITTLEIAINSVQKELKGMKRQLKDVLTSEDRALFDAYSLLLSSQGLVDETIERIHSGVWVQRAWCDVIHEHAQLFENMDDSYLRERAEDIREIGRRILMHLQESSAGPREYPRRTILVGKEIGVTQLAEVPPKRIAGIVSSGGSSSSHVAILARAIGVPAVMGASNITVGRLDGQEIIVDGYQGRIYIQPSPVVKREFGRLAREESKLSKELNELRDLPAKTPDGVHVPLYVNTGLLADIKPSIKSGADGIGLYRTEFPFMIRDRFPGVEEQREIYAKALKSFAPRPVTLRTLDVGGDKSLPYFPITEDNPFLGWRGVRITLDHPEIFLTQIRAMLSANIRFNNLQILLPMISDVGEVDECIVLIDQVVEELDEEIGNITRPNIGVMIEVPSAVYQVEEIAQRVDFLSIGTNDLTQYLLAVDRNNARVAKLYNSLHPSVLRAIKQVVAAGKKYGRPISVCGEMAGNPAAAILLLGLGVDSLSMAAASLLRIKWVIRSFSRRRAHTLLNKALKMDSADAIQSILNKALEDAGLGGLIRAGR